jgi:hypothetical protein
MSKPVYQSIEIESHKPVGPARHSVQFARSDAKRHQIETGKHCGVVRLTIIWTTLDHFEEA